MQKINGVEEKTACACLDVSWSRHKTVLHVFEAIFSVASVAHISVDSGGWVVKVRVFRVRKQLVEWVWFRRWQMVDNLQWKLSLLRVFLKCMRSEAK